MTHPIQVQFAQRNGIGAGKLQSSSKKYVGSDPLALSQRDGRLLSQVIATWILLGLIANFANNEATFFSLTQLAVRAQGALTLIASAHLLARRGFAKARSGYAVIVRTSLLWLMAVGTTLGLMNGFSKSYVLGDSERILMTLVVFELGRSMPPQYFWDCLGTWATRGLYIILPIHLALVAVHGYHRLGADTITPLVYALYRLTSREYNYGTKRAQVDLAICLLAITLTASRGDLLELGLVLLMFLLRPKTRTRKRQAYRIRPIVATILIATAMLVTLNTIPRGHVLIKETVTRAQQALRDKSQDPTISVRNDEVKAVNLERSGVGRSGQLLGFGSGAQFNPIIVAPVIDPSVTNGHSIHNTYYSVLFRYGDIGLGLLATILVLVAIRLLRLSRTEVGFAYFVLFVVSAVGAVIAYGLLGDFIWSALVGQALAVEDPAGARPHKSAGSSESW